MANIKIRNRCAAWLLLICFAAALIMGMTLTSFAANAESVSQNVSDSDGLIGNESEEASAKETDVGSLTEPETVKPASPTETTQNDAKSDTENVIIGVLIAIVIIIAVIIIVIVLMPRKK